MNINTLHATTLTTTDNHDHLHFRRCPSPPSLSFLHPLLTKRKKLAEEYCPVCKSSRYLNPSIKFLIEPTCYHKMCASCVDRLFGSGPNTCPVAGCNARLRAQRFRQQTFEDVGVEREVDVRRRVGRVFNRREEEFASTREWDDYLEMVETTTFELVGGDEAARKAAEARCRGYEAENAAGIRRNAEREKVEAMAFLVRERAEREEVMIAREAKAREEAEEKVEVEISRRRQIEAMARGDVDAIEKIKVEFQRRAEERRGRVRKEVESARGIREGRELAMHTLLAKAGREESAEVEEVWEPLGKGVSGQSGYYVLLEDYGKNDWVDEFVSRPEVSAGGYDRREWEERSLFEAFSGLAVFLGEEEDKSDDIPDRTDVVMVDAVS
jgi:CDK-activating kinase assembly factor MAT1